MQTGLTCLTLLKLVPPSLVMEALAECGTRTKRRRKLPDVLVVYLVIAMGLFRKLSMSDALERVVSALGNVLGVGWAPGRAPHPTSITRARDRVGWQALRKIFQTLARSLDLRWGKRVTWHGLVVRALDGSSARTADTRANDRCFGRPAKQGKRVSAYPQLRIVLIFDVFSRLVTDAVLGPYATSEVRVAEFLLERIERGTLLLLDRAFHSFTWPARLDRAGVKFVIRAKLGASVVKRRDGDRLGPGDRRCTLVASRPARKRFPSLPSEMTVRVITIRRAGFRPIELLTNLLSADDYSAPEIAELYRLRWESEHGFRELKAQLTSEHVIFRSHRPERVLQEAYGLLIAYVCARALICEAAEERDLPPLRLSFTRCVERIRHGFDDPGRERPDLLSQLGACTLQPKREGRRCPRERKARPNRYAVKRRGLPRAIGRYAWRATKRAEAAANAGVAR